MGLPTPMTLPPTFAHASPLVNAVGIRRDPLGFFTRLAREAGGFAHYELPSGVYYFVNDPALVREVLVARREEFVKWNFNAALKAVFRDSLIASEEPLHRRMQRIVRPALGRDRLTDYAQRMVDITGRRLDGWVAGEIDLARETSVLTLEIVAQCLFSFSLADVADEIIDSIDTIERYSARLGVVPEDDREFERMTAVLERIVRALLAARRAAGLADDDVLHLLLDAQEREAGTVTDENIHDEVRGFLLAGSMTTATALACAGWRLARDPALQEELAARVVAILGGRAPTLADVPALEFCEHVFLETLRLYPPVWALGREAVREMDFGGHTLPAGASLIICTWALHRDETRFPDPESFRPARWANGARGKLPVGGFLPFSVGPRSCLGERFATLEGTLLLACMLQGWRFSELPGAPDPGWSPKIILWPRRGVRLHAAPRRAP